MNRLFSLIRSVTSPLRRILFWPLKLIGAPKRLMGLSLPARVATLLGIFLFLLTITAYIAYFLNAGSAHIYEWLRPGRLGVIILLLVMIPIVVYQTLRLWLEGDLAKYPDIDEAWREGLANLQQFGLDLNQIPLFLVLGAPDERHADILMQAAGFELVVQSVPAGRAPLRWYASENAIFLFCTSTGCIGRLNQLGTSSAGAGGPQAANISGTLQQPQITGTLVAGSSPGVRDSSPGFAEMDEPDPLGGGAIRGTLMPSVHQTLQPGQPVQQQAAPGVSQVARRDLDEETERLRYVLQLMRRARQPLCPMNGAMVLLPLRVMRDILFAKDIPDTIRRDLASIRHTAQLCCPVTVLVTGMESESGFSELVRRVGVTRAKDSRFGKGFNVWNEPSAENLEALASEACGAFEDWVYALFREENGLAKPGNGKLYSLLATIRSQLHMRIRNILIRGLSCDLADDQVRGRPELVSGCYFCATGDTADRQAFVRSALEKMVQFEEELEWTDGALSENHRYQQLSQVGGFFNAILFLLLVGLIYCWWTGTSIF